MNPNEFIQTNLPFAKAIETETGIPAIAILAQAAFESGWGKKSIGNNIFGIKYKGKGLFQKVLTTEYFNDRNDFDGVIPDEDVVIVEYHLGINKFQVKAYLKFADYATPFEAFREHSRLLLTDRYIHALQYANDPKMYLRKIAESGYATLPDYAEKMADMVDSVIKRL